MTRRTFITAVAGTGLAMTTLDAPAQSRQNKTGSIFYRTLGKTGEKVSAIGLGGYHIGVPPEDGEGIRIIRSAIDRGITFMDNCWDYHDGNSEVRMGKALRDGYREKVFLMTKIDGRSKAGAAKQIDESLKRLQTDRADLIQFHEVIRMDDPDKIFAPGGAMEAMQDARRAGKVRFIGFTGHKDPSIHLHMLEVAEKNNFRFDTVQMPLNVMDAHYKSFQHKVLPVLLKRQIGVLGMKPLGSGEILRSNAVSAIECLHYALNLPASVIINGCDSMERLDQAFEAVATFKSMSSSQVERLLAKTAEPSQSGEFEPFKTTGKYDATAQHPAFLD